MSRYPSIFSRAAAACLENERSRVMWRGMTGSQGGSFTGSAAAKDVSQIEVDPLSGAHPVRPETRGDAVRQQE
jgi:hypothetical protein